MIKRMRVFAGPNGSGKSSIIEKILNTEVQEGQKLDFGIYINADNIASDLRENGCNFSTYGLDFSKDDFIEIVTHSGLISELFTLERFKDCISLKGNSLKINKKPVDAIKDNALERIAQILADYLRKKLLKEGKKFSFETVFSHRSKVDIIKEASKLGYKVYLYFVSTEDPEINVYRVKVVRVGENGHDVEYDKIISRYYRSMDLLYEAAQNCYQAYFFDNSTNGGSHTMFAHFKLNTEGDKQWDNTDKAAYPNWFKKYYSGKIESQKI